MSSLLDTGRAVLQALRMKDPKHLGLRHRLQLYLLALTLILSVFIIVILLSLDFFRAGGQHRLSGQIAVETERFHDNVEAHFSNTAAQGIHLARGVSARVDEFLERRKIDFSQVANNPALIEELEELAFQEVSDILLIADCSGAFVVFDTTVNDKLAHAQQSRAGIYLKYVNIHATKSLAPDLMWTRGMPSLGTRKGYIFHNQWELEFNMKPWPLWDLLREKARPELRNCYLYTPRSTLSGTWERMMLLWVPLVGRNGEFYGCCGLEINAILFKLLHGVGSEVLPHATGVLACRSGNHFEVSSGLASGFYASSFNNAHDLSFYSQPSEALFSYTVDVQSFVGKEKTLKLSPLDGDRTWTAAVLIPEDHYISLNRSHLLKIGLFLLFFVLLAILASRIIVRRLIDPIVETINAVKSGSATNTNIPEIDDLILFLCKQDTPSVTTASGQADMSAFHAFVENIKTLSKAEKAVFDLYLEGYSAPEIANQLHISMNTVKTHNKHIYVKLNVTSRKELMVYAQMMVRERDSGAT